MSSLRATVNSLTGLARHTTEKGKSWGPTAAAWGGSLTLIGIFLTDWKVITSYIPYIKDKYDHKPPR